MKKLLTISAILLMSMSYVGCGVSWSNVAYSDDLYEIHDKINIANKQKAEAELAKAEAEAMQAQYEMLIARAKAQAAEKGVTLTEPTTTVNGFSAVLADDYESAYARRLYGFRSPTYRMPSSYYTYRFSDAFFYASAYDPAFYNVMVSGDMIWVEPKYVTSMFGTWGATVVPTYSWYYGWGNPYWSWGRYNPYGYGWYNYWYSGYYNPFFSWGFPYYPYHPHYHHHHHHPHHPPHFGGGVGNTGHRPAQPGRPTYRNNKAQTPSVREGSSSRGSSYRTPSSGGSSYRSNSSSSSSSSRSSSYQSGSSSSSSSRYRSSGGATYRPSSGSSNYGGGSRGR